MIDSILQTRTLHLAKTVDEYDLYKAALEYTLIEPIVIESEDDLHSELQWRNLLSPFHHQVKNLITFCRRLPVTLLADDVGLGKTISAGLITSELISRGRISKILIVCPKLLLPQWKEELETKFSIHAVEAVGKQIITAISPDETGAVITTYQSARMYINHIKSIGFEMLILDEAHKLRNLYGTDSAPQVATCFREALVDRVFKYVLMLTATPIQNRLWDAYSLIDLLSVARGHDNPFGKEGIFARRFIADSKTQARQLKPEMRDEFRSIIYGYMSRTRRDDARLYFPERKIQMHKVVPTPEELEIIDVIREPILELIPLVQISILQALVSSPQALSAQLDNMARKGTVSVELARSVSAIVNRMGTSAKLKGLEILIANLRREKPDDWRVVIFTERRETQTTIEAFLDERGINCGLINGDSGLRNQETISKLKSNPPEIHVIISTRAGAEGVNLQAANILVNYDLPWNPMIVEQRIGRIQRLASEHANVWIFNMILTDTFEEKIVGRLMEKLQLASSAIGDIESLMEASGIEDNESNKGTNSFEEKIRSLVIDSLSGKDVAVATQRAEKSILDAKEELEKEEKNINDMLGGMNDSHTDDPKCPILPHPPKSMDVQSLVLKGLEKQGFTNQLHNINYYTSTLNGTTNLICFTDDAKKAEDKSTLYKPGKSVFERLVAQLTQVAQHQVTDIDIDIQKNCDEVVSKWINSFDGKYSSAKVISTERCFDGTALTKVRATVAYDSYERLIDVTCFSDIHSQEVINGINPISVELQNPNILGIQIDQIKKHALEDKGITDFCNFYLERLDSEVQFTLGDDRKMKKLEDDLTPRITIELVGLKGKVHRKVKCKVLYTFDTKHEYQSTIIIHPSSLTLLYAPDLERCEKTNYKAPKECLAKCSISGLTVLDYLLEKSEVSERKALPEYIVKCNLSGQFILRDEADVSAMTGKLILSSLLKTSILSNRRAEPDFFSHCDFTGVELLKDESVRSQVSGKFFRKDEELRSEVSGKIGHRSEFIICALTHHFLLPNEAEECAITGKKVMPGLLELCEISGMKVLPSELEKSAFSGKRALKKFFVLSNLSGTNLLEEEAVKSVDGNFCDPSEAITCAWSGKDYHPEDIRNCLLTGLSIYFKFINETNGPKLKPLLEMLNGESRTVDCSDLWDAIANYSNVILKTKKCLIDSSTLSPSKTSLAVLVEVKSWLGFKVRYAGFIYSIKENTAIGRVMIGSRYNNLWVAER